MIRESKEMLDWIAEQGVRFQPSLGGTLSLGRTNSFFLGGGRAMLNALYLTAESLGVEVLYERRGASISTSTDGDVSVGDRRASRRAHDGRARRALVAACRRLRGQYRMAEGILGRAGRQLPHPRHAATTSGAVLKMLIDRGVEEIGDPDAMPCGRDRRARAEIRRRHHHATRLRGRSASSSTSTRSASTTRARTSGPSATRSGVGWSPRSPDQIAYIIFDAPALKLFMPSLLPADRGADASPSLRPSSDSIRRRSKRRLTSSMPPCGPARSTTRSLDDCRTEGLDAAQDALGAAHRDAAVLRLSGAARHHLHLSRRRG